MLNHSGLVLPSVVLGIKEFVCMYIYLKRESKRNICHIIVEIIDEEQRT